MPTNCIMFFLSASSPCSKEGPICKRIEPSLPAFDDDLWFRGLAFHDYFPWALSSLPKSLSCLPKTWSKESIYGKRDGSLSGLLIVSKAEKNNIFKSTKAFKQGTIRNHNAWTRWHVEARGASSPNMFLIVWCSMYLSIHVSSHLSTIVLMCCPASLAGTIQQKELATPWQSSHRRPGNAPGMWERCSCHCSHMPYYCPTKNTRSLAVEPNEKRFKQMVRVWNPVRSPVEPA